MGNGPEGSGDGWKYRGHGLIQCTGKANHDGVMDLLRQHRADVPDFVAKPELLAEPLWAAFSAAAIWHIRGCNEAAHARDFRGITRKINGGLLGYPDRVERLNRATKALRA
jgi:putative chitinase